MRMMPRLSQEETLIFNRIVLVKNGVPQLRATKPKIEYSVYTKNGLKYREPTYETGIAAYVWRMVAFMASPKGQHHCMPMCATFDLPTKDLTYDQRRDLEKKWLAFADKIVNAIPKTQWHGVKRWGQAMGKF